MPACEMVAGRQRSEQKHPGAANASPAMYLASKATSVSSPSQWQQAGNPCLLAGPLSILGAFPMVAVTPPVETPCPHVVLAVCAGCHGRTHMNVRSGGPCRLTQ